MAEPCLPLYSEPSFFHPATGPPGAQPEQPQPRPVYVMCPATASRTIRAQSMKLRLCPGASPEPRRPASLRVSCARRGEEKWEQDS